MTKEEIIKRVDEICSDESGADKPYREHCEKWGKILFNDFLIFNHQSKTELLEKMETELKKYKCGKHKKLFKLIKQL